ncbi:hypothetical protein JTE90_000980 [Oedothorax gibbosus]|uniref:PDZ domain-containing protein n=1 Tax=Oedothorax gibbosus TaxID=931172 RepID=A0AAV6VBV3_9ARAC|nr:hypothetical protein JTE90_000980 [Oedothorax gibbosus]
MSSLVIKPLCDFRGSKTFSICMDVISVPSNGPTLHSSRSFRARHGPVQGPVSGPPSPDSACDNDDWAPATEGPSVPRKRCGGDAKSVKSLAGQDSDVDSGIVTCRVSGQRIGSTSSADTDSSQESRRRIEYSPPIQKSELTKSRCYAGSLRIPRRTTCQSPCGPVKGDHSALKECNRRPPTPLTVFPDSHHCVRFDEQLQLSEQNIRRSCRKLFATLYAQRFSYQEHLANHGRMHAGTATRSRSRTVPELELGLCNGVLLGHQQHSTSNKYARSCKENVGPVEGRSGSFSSGSRSAYKSRSDTSAKIPHMHSFRIPVHPRLSMEQSEDGTSHSNSTDSGLGSLRSGTQCTCNERPLPSSQSNNVSIECTCNQPKSQQESPSKLFKSSSCSTLSSVLSHQSRPQLTQFPPRVLRKVVSTGEDRSKPSSIHKTSSCSNLLDKAVGGLQLSNVPVYNDNMMQVYARIASVIPDDHYRNCAASPTQSNGSCRRSKTLGRTRHTADNVYDALWQSNYMRTTSIECETPRVVGRRISSLTSENDSNSRTNIPEMTTFKPDLTFKSTEGTVNDTDNKSIHSVEIYSQIPDRVVEPFVRKSLRESVQSRNSVMQRPKSVGVVVPNPVYLKSALKKSTQSAILHGSETAVKSQVIKPCEVEYAVVDKSKKNRFTSLPALNGGNCTLSTQENDEKDPPVPPKKMLHKSDFSLYRSRSTSPKKGLLERMQAISKSARSALQKAFSSERIYRPEKEERLEAVKQLGRSRSFLKHVKGSFRRKKRRRDGDPTTPEIVPQASSNPEWDEQTLGPDSPIHVRGQLLELKIDGSQVVELTKTPSKPYGFFVARGRVRNSKGVFVSRMRDQETKKQLSGLLDIGDEILEINGFNVKEADILEVNRLMANKNSLLLTVLPYLCRKDV